MSIRHLIFDLGNVIIDLDIPRTEQAFRALLGEHFARSYQQIQLERIFDRYEVGEMDEAAFLQQLQAAAHPFIADDQALIDAWNGMLLGIPPQRFQLLTDLRERGYGIYLFSNTNATHLRWVDTHLRAQHGMSIEEFDRRYFDKAYYSHLIRQRKPHTAAFRFVVEDAGLLVEESVFIDDNADNIAGARAIGLHTLHHAIGQEIAEVLPAWLNEQA